MLGQDMCEVSPGQGHHETSASRSRVGVGLGCRSGSTVTVEVCLVLRVTVDVNITSIETLTRHPSTDMRLPTGGQSGSTRSNTRLVAAVLQRRQLHAEAEGAAGGGVALAGLPLAQAVDEQVRRRLARRRRADQHAVHVHQHLRARE